MTARKKKENKEKVDINNDITPSMDWMVNGVNARLLEEAATKTKAENETELSQASAPPEKDTPAVVIASGDNAMRSAGQASRGPYNVRTAPVEDAQAVEIAEEPKAEGPKAEEAKKETEAAPTPVPAVVAVEPPVPAAPAAVVTKPEDLPQNEPLKGVTVRMPMSLHRRLTVIKYTLVDKKTISDLGLRAIEEYVLRMEHELGIKPQ